MQSLVQYLLTRGTEECCEAGQAFSKLFTFGVHHRHPVTKDLAITKASKEINDILGVVAMLRDFGVDIFGIGKPEDIEAKKLKIFRNMQESIDVGALVLTPDEMARLNATYPDEKPLKPAPVSTLDFGTMIAELHKHHPELFVKDIHVDMLIEIAKVKGVKVPQRPLPIEDGVTTTHVTDGGVTVTL